MHFIAIVYLLFMVTPTVWAHRSPKAQLTYLQSQLKKEPTNQQLQLRYTKALLRIGDFQQAAAALAKLRPSAEQLPEVLLLEASWLTQQNLFSAAEKKLQVFLQRFPDHVQALEQLAKIKEQQGRYSEAIEYFRQAARLDRNPDHYLVAAKVASKQRDMALARQILIEGWLRLDYTVSLEKALIHYGANAADLAVRKKASVSRKSPVKPMSSTVLPQPSPVILDRQPYIQLLTDSSAVVVWRSLLPSDGELRYGLDPNQLDQVIQSPQPMQQHEIVISGLNPSTRYYYALYSNSQLIAGDEHHYFETAPVVGSAQKTRIWVVGDSGTGALNQSLVRDAMVQFAGNHKPDLFLHVGDMAYNDGTDLEFSFNFYAPYADILRNTPIWPALGNHEAVNSSSGNQSGPYYEGYLLPTAAQAGGLASGTEAYYSFDYGNIHFVVLDSQDSSRATDGAMLTWMVADLQATQQEWIVAYFHHPPYTKGTHDSDHEIQHVEMRENVIPLLEQHGVDLVLGGHSHIYERSYLLSGAYDTPSTTNGILDSSHGRISDGDAPYRKAATGGHEGALYVVAGHGGRSVGGPANHPLMAFSEVAYGSVIIDIEGNRLSISNIRYDGSVTDRTGLIKGEGLLLTSPYAGTLQPNSSIDISWSGTPAVEFVDLMWSCDGGQHWQSIATQQNVTGSYSWTVPMVDSDDVIFRVQQSDQPEIYDESDAAFTISEQISFQIPFGSSWKYHDQGEDLGNTWMELTYDDSSWAQGSGQLGYGDGDEATELASQDPNYPSAYFRKTFQLDGEATNAVMEVIYDDAFAVWINGHLEWSINMDNGTAYDDWASELSTDNAAAIRLIDPELFLSGQNTIAVMVKQRDESSSDLTFDLSLDVQVNASAAFEECNPSEEETSHSEDSTATETTTASDNATQTADENEDTTVPTATNSNVEGDKNSVQVRTDNQSCGCSNATKENWNWLLVCLGVLLYRRRKE